MRWSLFTGKRIWGQCCGAPPRLGVAPWSSAGVTNFRGRWSCLRTNCQLLKTPGSCISWSFSTICKYSLIRNTLLIIYSHDFCKTWHWLRRPRSYGLRHGHQSCQTRILRQRLRRLSCISRAIQGSWRNPRGIFERLGGGKTVLYLHGRIGTSSAGGIV